MGREDECIILNADFIPIIKGSIDGQEYHFLIDTGASISVVDKYLLEKYFPNKRISRVSNIDVVGYGGIAQGLKDVDIIVKSGKLKFSKEWKVQDINQIVRTTREQTGYRIVGIIGNNNLQNMIIDLKAKRIY